MCGTKLNILFNCLDEFGDDCVDDDVCESNTQCISDVCSCPAESEWDDAISACVSTAGMDMSRVL